MPWFSSLWDWLLQRIHFKSFNWINIKIYFFKQITHQNMIYLGLAICRRELLFFLHTQEETMSFYLYPTVLNTLPILNYVPKGASREALPWLWAEWHKCGPNPTPHFSIFRTEGQTWVDKKTCIEHAIYFFKLAPMVVVNLDYQWEISFSYSSYKKMKHLMAASNEEEALPTTLSTDRSCAH